VKSDIFDENKQLILMNLLFIENIAFIVMKINFVSSNNEKLFSSKGIA